jgi:mannose-6-phosphate isomerase-like protein (cupin superfamily)
VEHLNLKNLVRFSPDGIQRETVFETDRLWSQIVCFDRTQALGPVTDMDSDALFLIVAGEAAVQVDGRRKRLGQWGTVLVPAGAAVTVTNASTEPLVVLVVASPPPVPHAVDG